jgi:hypothetical protein
LSEAGKYQAACEPLCRSLLPEGIFFMAMG